MLVGAPGGGAIGFGGTAAVALLISRVLHGLAGSHRNDPVCRFGITSARTAGMVLGGLIGAVLLAKGEGGNRVLLSIGGLLGLLIGVVVGGLLLGLTVILIGVATTRLRSR